MICRYCHRTDDEMFVVRAALKPKGSPYRWSKLGHCCHPCGAAGQPVTIDLSLKPEKIHPVTKFAAEVWRNPT